MQPAGGVDYYRIGISGLGGAYAVIHDGSRVSPLLVAHYVGSRALCPDAQLLGGGGAEGIAGAQKYLFPVLLQAGGKLAYGGGLADAVYSDHEDDGGLCF